ncbi:hypothetical protein ACVIKO_005898 [Rhizobium ruizarguesonis]
MTRLIATRVGRSAVQRFASLRDDLEQIYGDPVAIWKDWAIDVSGFGIDSGHHVAEENPVALAKAIVNFLTK